MHSGNRQDSCSLQQTPFHGVTPKTLPQKCPELPNSPHPGYHDPLSTHSLVSEAHRERLYLSISDLHCPELNGWVESVPKIESEVSQMLQAALVYIPSPSPPTKAIFCAIGFKLGGPTRQIGMVTLHPIIPKHREIPCPCPQVEPTVPRTLPAVS